MRRERFVPWKFLESLRRPNAIQIGTETRDFHQRELGEMDRWMEERGHGTPKRNRIRAILSPNREEVFDEHLTASDRSIGRQYSQGQPLSLILSSHSTFVKEVN